MLSEELPQRLWFRHPSRSGPAPPEAAQRSGHQCAVQCPRSDQGASRTSHRPRAWPPFQSAE
eukprot:437006-Pyramimonas_sp.AAC.1